MTEVVYGQLSKKDILKEEEQNGLKIIPREEKRLKAASYDVTPTIIAMSTKLGMLETVYKEKDYPHRYFIYVQAKDTVLIVSNEYFIVPQYIAGYVVSRLSKVAEGFGHISTSIDPNWKGALLIALSNPMNRPIKVYVGGTACQIENNNSLATVSFHYLNTECSETDIEHREMRFDLLEKHNYSQRRGIRAFFNKLFHPKRRKYTDFFINYCKNTVINEESWNDVVKDFQGMLPVAESNCKYCEHFKSNGRRAKSHFADFIVTETTARRLKYWYEKHGTIIWTIIKVAFALLIALKIMPEGWQDALLSFLESFRLF